MTIWSFNMNRPTNVLSILFAASVLLMAQGCSSQKAFNSPEQAADALVTAARSGNIAQLTEILGKPAEPLLDSGDPVADRNALNKFVTAYDQNCEIEMQPDGSFEVVVGKDQWPLPFPIVLGSGGWRFDTARGVQEIIDRRVGRNELNTIQTCLAIADAQQEYALMDSDQDGVNQYAQFILSRPGRKNGLYWPTGPGEKPSPLGPLVAEATSEGYGTTQPVEGAKRAYHGYFFKLLTSQGPAARSGARDYIVDGQMLGGFALVAYPAEYRNSGIMTFIINQDGTVYQRDLGEGTAQVVATMTTFNPDESWTEVADEK